MGNTSLNISLPEGLKAFVKERVQQAHYSTPSDYVRDLIRADQKRQAKEKLDQLLLEGLETASEEVTPEYLEQLRHDIQALIKPHKISMRLRIVQRTRARQDILDLIAYIAMINPGQPRTCLPPTRKPSRF